MTYSSVIEGGPGADRCQSNAMASAFPHLTGSLEVGFRMDGRAVTVMIELDLSEHQRRVGEGVGAVTGTGVLHGLWLLPSGIPVPVDRLPPVKQSRLREQRGVCIERHGYFERTYVPPGKVLAVAIESSNPDRALGGAAQLPPIFQRAAIVGPLGRLRGVRLMTEATQVAIGLVERSASGPRVLVTPPPSIIGRPGVYRWWIAELAYAALLQESTQLVS